MQSYRRILCAMIMLSLLIPALPVPGNGQDDEVAALQQQLARKNSAVRAKAVDVFGVSRAIRAWCRRCSRRCAMTTPSSARMPRPCSGNSMIPVRSRR